jgi:hypothetical protein
MLAVIPKDSTNGKMWSVAKSWSQRGVIPIQARGMTKRVEKYRIGDSKNVKKAFKKWAHGSGADRIVPIDEFNE